MNLDELDTPSLVIHLDALERNIGEMAAVANAAGVRLRPHTKTHKAPEIARMQVEAGAAGITVAKLGEAEVMADAGLEDLLIAFPLVGERKLTRLRELLERADVRVSLDAVEVAEGVGRVGKDLGCDVPCSSRSTRGYRMGRAAGDRRRASRWTSRPSPASRCRAVDPCGSRVPGERPRELRTIAPREVLDLIDTAERCRREAPIREISVGSPDRPDRRVPGRHGIAPASSSTMCSSCGWGSRPRRRVRRACLRPS
jgi:hypothetical protein